MFSRPETATRSDLDRGADPFGSTPPRDSGSAHYVSLLRQPSIRGRVAMIFAIILAIGPGGTLVFRVTQSLLAADPAGNEEATGEQGAVPLATTTTGEKRTPSDAAGGFTQPAESQAVGWQSAPHWDLTQQAADAWMVVEQSSDDPEARPVRTHTAAHPEDSTVMEALTKSVKSEIELVSGEQAMPVIAPSARNWDEIPPPPRSNADNAPTERAAESSITIQPNELANTRSEWFGFDDNYFVNTEAQEAPPSQPAPAESEFTPAEPKPAPVAPPANFDSPPVTQAPPAAPPDSPKPAPPAVDVPTVDVPHEFHQPSIAGVTCNTPPMYGQAYPAHSAAMVPGQACGNCSRPICGIHCNGETCCQDLQWRDSWLIPWEVFAQGEYIGPARMPHVPEYRLRVDDNIEFVYRITGQKSAEPYLINTGDILRIESLTADTLNREVIVQPDGTVSLPFLGQVLVAGRSIEEVRKDLDKRYQEQFRDPSITVTPVKLNSVLEELRATIDNRYGNGGQSRFARVTPEGTVQLPAIGSVPAHGLTLAELGAEIQYRYEGIVHGIEVTPILAERAPRYVYVLGEVRAPGRYTLEGPTTLTQAIALAGGWNVGANLTQVVVFRRDDCWNLMATKVGLRRSLYGKDPCPEGELWIRDSDIVVVPKSPILVLDEFIELVFTRGIYGVIPFSTNLSFVKDLSSAATTAVVPIP